MTRFASGALPEVIFYWFGYRYFDFGRVCNCFGVFGEPVLSVAYSLLASKQRHGEFVRLTPCQPLCFRLHDARELLDAEPT